MRGFLLALLLLGDIAAAATPDWLNLPGARQEMVDEPVFGGKVWVYEVGPPDKPAVVLVHGLGNTGADTWKGLIPELAQRYRVLVFDLPGFGRSSRGNHLYSPANYVAFIRFITSVRLASPFKLVGHSLGGAIALRYTATHPEDVTQLVLVNVAGILHRTVYAQFLTVGGAHFLPEFDAGQERTLPGLTGKVLRHIDNIAPDPNLVLRSAALREKLLRGEPLRIAALALVQDNFAPLIPRVKVPTRILWGEQDPIAPLRTGKLLAANIAGARLTVLPGLKHVPMEEEPRSFNAFITEELGLSPEALTQLGAEQAYALSPALLNQTRLGRCEKQQEVTFRGDYLRIEIDGCRKVRLTDVRTRYVSIQDSQVEIENSHVLGEKTGLLVKRSELKVTGGSIRGEVALELDGSQLDLAGVRLFGGRAALKGVGKDKSEATFSVSWITRGGGESIQHGVQTLEPGGQL